jgi:hypothetical protein
MTIEVPSVAVPLAPSSTTAGEAASVDERWAAWQARGAAHDRAFRRKVAVVAPILIAIAAVVVYALVGR